MKLHLVFGLLALVQSIVASSDVDQLNRYPRDADGIKVSLSRLKMVARVTAGIQLTQDLIKGTAKTEEMAAELLKINPLTPTQIAALDTAALETAVTALKNLKTAVTPQDNSLKDAMDNLVQFAKIKKELEGVTDFETWPAKAEFSSALDAVKTNGVDLSISQQIKAKLISWGETYGKLRDESDDAVIKFKSNELAKDTDKLLDALNSAVIPQFSSSGYASEMFSDVSKIIGSSQLMKTLKPNVDKSKYSAIATMLSTFYTTGAQVSSVTPSLTMIESILTARSTLDSSRKLEHTYGLLGGHQDVNTLFADIQDSWLNGISKSSNLEGALRELRKLLSPATSFESKIGSINQGDSRVLAEIRKLGELIKGEFAVLKNTSVNSTTIRVAMTTIGNLQIGTAPQKLDEAKSVRDLVIELDNLISPYTKAVSDAVSLLTTTLSSNLTDFKTECAKAEDQGADLAAVQTKIKEFSNLHSKMIALWGSFPTTHNNDAIKEKAGEIESKLANIDTFLQSMDGYSDTFWTLTGLTHLELVKNMENFRNVVNPPDYDRANAIIASIDSSKSVITNFKGVMDEIKGKTSEESNALGLLRDSKKTAESIGRAVRAVATMDEVFRRRADVALVLQHIELATSQIPDGFDPNDNATLSALVALKPRLTAMASSLDTWHSAVKDVVFDKLTDGDNIFSPAKQVTGVAADLVPMLVALEHLIEKVPGSSTSIADLRSMKSSLSTLSSFPLDFASYQVALDSAGASIVLFATFLAAYNLQIGSNSGTAGGNKDGGGSANGAMTAESDEIPTWTIVLIVIGSLLLLVALAVCIVLVAKMKNVVRAQRQRALNRKTYMMYARGKNAIDGVGEPNKKKAGQKRKSTNDE